MRAERPDQEVAPSLVIGTPVDECVQWRERARLAAALVRTPCYVFDIDAVRRALSERHGHCSIRRRHWLSCKTQPIRPLVEAWRDWGLGVEVVSDYELRAVLATGVPGDRILVNGVAKHTWLRSCSVRKLNVQFDSLAEIDELAHTARRHEWKVGLRCQVPNQHDPEEPEIPDQFGLIDEEIPTAMQRLRAAGVAPRGIHCHLGGTLTCDSEYGAALSHLRTLCERVRLRPSYVDVGGGLPAPDERRYAAPLHNPPFDFSRFDELISDVPRMFPSAEEVWLENGRCMTARAGALVISVLDRKDRAHGAYLICDGGRINHARMAALERHTLVTDPVRDGPTRLTTVCGPTSAGVDKLGRWMLPESLRPGDRLIWLNAGAYHIPLETRFSVGLAPVVWFDGASQPRVVRRRETAVEWWAQWI